MARSHFAGTSVDWLLRPYRFGGTTLMALKSGTTILDFYSAATGGTHYTDLLDSNGSAASQIAVTDYQIPSFQGPDAILAMWADKGDGSPREYIEAQDLAAAASAVTAAAASAAAAAASAAATVVSLATKLDIREAPLTPWRYGATGNTTGDDNTAPLASMFAVAVAAGTAAEVYIPPGVWTTTGGSGGNLPLASNLTIRGAGRQMSAIRTASGAASMFQWNTNISGVRIEDLYLNGSSSSGHIFEPGASGGIYGSTFKNLFMAQQVDGKRIWYQDNGASFIHMTFEECEMYRTAGSTVAPFYVKTSAGAANCNLFKQVRANGSDNTTTPFFYFESSLALTYLTDWQFLGIVGEQNRGGLIHMVAACGVTMIAVTDEDAGGAYTADVIKFSANGLGLAPRDLTLIGCTRRGSTLGGGINDIYVDSGGKAVTLINCNPTPTSADATISVPADTTLIGMRVPVAKGTSVRARPRRNSISARRLPLSGYPYPMVNTGSLTLAKDTWRYMPLSVETGFSIANLAILLLTAATGGTADMRFALYQAASDGTPATLAISYTPTLDLTTGAGAEKATTTLAGGEQVIPAGEWFLGIAWTGTATASPTLSPITGTHPSVSGAAVGASHNAYSQAVSGGSAPSPAVPSSTTAQGACVWGVLL